MYAVIQTGGKQYRVQEGDTLDVERIDVGPDETVSLTPVMVVGDGGAVAATPDQLRGAEVEATVVEQIKGPKITVQTYRNKTGNRRKLGHRQHITRVRVDRIAG
ncbi:50S ribosomal protein L21 [Egibacter rhizosphaerae]|uniref:Large ribosomal subunit protein bL21 n=1 Tax=Egibacter rhizosphaerae TaxID=1670831 RepID=A0A411YBU4_9ACTN|nr:50S ribosomal protein L21 [Egibacter rhizosphaerae]QBI18655.1 50S ribosomal protein L21 [Egibacter rhizosphaerae]